MTSVSVAATALNLTGDWSGNQVARRTVSCSAQTLAISYCKLSFIATLAASCDYDVCPNAGNTLAEFGGFTNSF